MYLFNFYRENFFLFSSDFDLDKFRQRLLHKQQQEQTALQNHEVNADNLSKSTALMIAVQWGDLPTVQKLLENGANPDQADNIVGYSARDYATRDRRAANILRLIQEIKTDTKTGPK